LDQSLTELKNYYNTKKKELSVLRSILLKPEVRQNSYTASRRGYSLTKTGILVEGRAPLLLYPELGTSKMVIPSQREHRIRASIRGF
jgi:hypothetical protein